MTTTPPTSPTTTRSFNAYRSPTTDRVRLPLTPITGKTQNVVYEILDREGSRPYVGKTGQELRRRISQHLYHVNNVTDQSGGDFYSALRERPEDFSLRVLSSIDEEDPRTGVSLEDLEEEFIEETSAQETGYNKNKGRGGGTARSASSSLSDEEFMPQFTTPQKYYPVKRVRDAASVLFTPGGANKENVIYVLKDKKERRYIGCTGRPLKLRIGEHFSHSRRPEKRAGKRPLPTALRDHPEDFQVGILHESEDGTDLHAAEVYYIKTKQSQEHGYNQNSGGGGSSVVRLFDSDS